MTEPLHCTSGRSDDEARESSILHATGALTPEEARAFEGHVAAGCPFCARELRAHEEVMAELARAAASATPAPSPDLRARLLDAVSRESRAGFVADTERGKAESIQVWKAWRSDPGVRFAEGLHLVRAAEGAWEATGVPGVSVKTLFVDRTRRYVTMLVRMEAGTSYPPHRHGGYEECYVIEGDLRVGDEILRSGDYQRADARSVHGVQSTEGGCLLLIVSSQEDELVR